MTTTHADTASRTAGTLGPAVLVDAEPNAVWIALSRPPLNIFDLAALRELAPALESAGRSHARVVVLRSDVPRAFSAGVDVADHTADSIDELLDVTRVYSAALLQLDSIVIAGLHGWALGGLAELALLADVVIAADDTTIGIPEIHLGMLAPVGSALLPRLCGGRWAARLMLGENVDAPTAQRIGLVTEVVPRNDLVQRVRARADSLAGLSGSALRAAKRAMTLRERERLLDEIAYALETYRRAVARSADAAEGIAAFLEKRQPRWST